MNYRSLIASFAVVAMVVAGVSVTGCLDDGDDEGKVVYWTTVAPNLQKAALTAGEVDGAVAWEPFASDAVLDGVAEIYKWSDEIWPGHPCCVVATDAGFLEDNHDVVVAFLKAHIEANEWIADAVEQGEGSDNYTLLLQMGADFAQRDESVIASSLEHIIYETAMTEEFMDGVQTVTEKYIELDIVPGSKIDDRGYDSVDDFVDQYFDASLLAEAEEWGVQEQLLNADDPVRVGYLAGDVHQLARVVAENETVGGGQSLFETYGVATTDAAGSPYANGGYVMDPGFISGEIDIGYLGSPPAILKHLNTNVDTVVISQVNSVGSAIFVDESIQTLEDFDGKTIATPGEASIQHLMFLDYFKENGFTVKLLGA